MVDAAVLLILLMRRRTLPPHEEQRMRWVISLSSGAVFRNQGGGLHRLLEEGMEPFVEEEAAPESDAVVLRSLEVGAPVRLDHEWEADDLPVGLEAPCLSVPVRSEIPEATAVALFGPHETGNDIDEDEREVLDRARCTSGC